MTEQPGAESPSLLADELANFREIAAALDPSPGQIPELKGIDICGLQLPLRGSIGGDHLIYIDFRKRFDLDARVREAERQDRPVVARQLRVLAKRAGILVADVSGHRMTDALIAAMLHQAFLLGVYYELDMFGEVTTKLFEHINTRFYRSSRINKYFTMIYGEISEEGKFRFISAGHQPPAVFSREYGRFMPVSEDRLVSFLPVGMLPSSADPDEGRRSSVVGYKRRYEVNEINLLADGDILLLHTDGLTEHAGGGFFPAAVERLLAELRDAPSARVCRSMHDAILEAGGQEDDISFVVIKKVGRHAP